MYIVLIEFVSYLSRVMLYTKTTTHVDIKKVGKTRVGAAAMILLRVALVCSIFAHFRVNSHPLVQFINDVIENEQVPTMLQVKQCWTKQETVNFMRSQTHPIEFLGDENRVNISIDHFTNNILFVIDLLCPGGMKNMETVSVLTVALSRWDIADGKSYNYRLVISTLVRLTVGSCSILLQKTCMRLASSHYDLTAIWLSLFIMNQMTIILWSNVSFEMVQFMCLCSLCIQNIMNTLQIIKLMKHGKLENLTSAAGVWRMDWRICAQHEYCRDNVKMCRVVIWKCLWSWYITRLGIICTISSKGNAASLSELIVIAVFCSSAQECGSGCCIQSIFLRHLYNNWCHECHCNDITRKALGPRGSEDETAGGNLGSIGTS